MLVGTVFEGSETKVFPIELLRSLLIDKEHTLPTLLIDAAEDATTSNRFIAEVSDNELLYIGMELGQVLLKEHIALDVLQYLQKNGDYKSLSKIYGDRFCVYNEQDYCTLIKDMCMCIYYCPRHEFSDQSQLPTARERNIESTICTIHMAMETAGISSNNTEYLHKGWFGIEFGYR